MADQTDVLLNIYQEHCAWERHHEEQRATVTNLLIAVAAGVISVITFDGKLSTADFPLALFLVMQGIFGALFTAKHYERFAMHQKRADLYRKTLDSLYPETNIIFIRKSADEEHALEYPWFHRLPLNKFWISLHLIIAVFGCILSAGILLHWFN